MKKTVIFLASALALFAASCTSQPVSDPNGEGVLTLNAGLVSTKAAYTDDQLLENALVNIYYADFSGLVRQYRYSEVPQTIYLPANEYRVDVIAGEASKDAPSIASWEQKSYKGSQTFEIKSGVNTSVQVLAGVSNAVSLVSFDTSVAENFADGYTLTVSLGDNSLVYDKSKDGAEGYFIISGIDDPAFDWTFSGTLASDGSALTKSGRVEGLEPGKAYKLSLKYTIKDGLASFDLYVDSSTDIIEDSIVFEPVSTGLSASLPYEIWAGHATVHADVDESENPDPTAVKFAYSTDGINWITVDSERTGEGTYQAVLAGLSPSTEYTYKLVIGGVDAGESMSFVTDVAPNVPNPSFEYSTTSKSGKFKEFYDPSAPEADCTTLWWGSGNGSDDVDGSADFGGFIICAPDTSEKVDGNQSACLQSTWALVKFAAGNLFSGSFAGLVKTEGGKVNFGRPFTARPTALKVWLKYSAGKINRVSGMPDDDQVSTSDYDRARLFIALGTWDSRTYGGTKESPVQVNTTDVSTFVDFSTDPKTIAYGNLVLQSDAANSLNTWIEYTIPLEYSSLTTMPTHIIISGASSMLGDYFTGCDSAKLWVDKMQLIYE